MTMAEFYDNPENGNMAVCELAEEYNGGWIKLHRSFLETGILKNGNLVAFWSYLLLRANYKPQKVVIGYQTEELEPGQLVFGRKEAAKYLGQSESMIQRNINFLKKKNMITQISNNKYSIITIVNWLKFQQPCDDIEQQANGKRTSSERQANTDKEVKEVKEVKELKEKDKSLSKLSTPFSTSTEQKSKTRKCRKINLEEPKHHPIKELMAYHENGCKKLGIAVGVYDGIAAKRIKEFLTRMTFDDGKKLIRNRVKGEGMKTIFDIREIFLSRNVDAWLYHLGNKEGIEIFKSEPTGPVENAEHQEPN